MAITITGANGEVYTLAAATGRGRAPALQLQSKINTAVAQNPDSVGFYSEAGVYQASSAYEYLVVADDTDTSTGGITLNNAGFSANLINILAGRKSGTTYNANNESGQIVNTAGSLDFNGAGKTGAWTLFTGDGNSTIKSTDGNNRINTGTGKNTITLGFGNNSVYSEGQDTITGGGTGYQSVTLVGSNSQVSIDGTALVADASTGEKNTISVGKNSTVTGGSSTTVTYTDGDKNEFLAGNQNTVSAAANVNSLKVIHGGDNTFNVNNKLGLFNANGNTNVTVNGQFVGFGASDSNYTVNAGGSDSGLFVANIGNETLNASGSTAAIQIYANTVSGAQSNFVASGGSANDTLVAGTGNSTFSGGAGDNLFLFTKETGQGGNTVITDFANSSQNKIGLLNFGLDDNSLAQLLKNSQNDTSGNAVLNIEGRNITVENVAVSDLNADRFVLINTPTHTA